MWTQLLIVCPLVFLGGFVDAIAGGGGLITLPAYLLAGLPPHNAIATNKVSSSCGGFVAMVKLGRAGCIPLRECLFAVPCALIGSAAGAKLALSIGDDVFRMILLVVLPLTALYVLAGKGLKDEPSGPPLSDCRLYAFTALISLLLGVYDGFYGPGTGTFLLLLFTGVAKMNVRNAAGLSKAVNFSTNIGSLVTYALSGKAIFALGLPAALCSMLGARLGSSLFLKDGTRIVRPVMLGVLGIFFVKTLYELLF
ncbi:MAG: TSUP family transporter [Clostridia bacterium]|nr:TSUP family transporter [Clostridia bacterium]